MEKDKVIYNSLNDVPKETWDNLSKKKIYFGHQSVGYNILDGVNDLMQEYPDIHLAIEKTDDLEKHKGGVLAHSEVGQNTDPKSKMNDFKRNIDHSVGENGDVATLKFCYVDITKETDVEKLFEEYKSEIQKIRIKYPKLTIVHFTEPLTINKTSWKISIKKLLGMEIDSVADNMKRSEYNELIKKEYTGKEPIFDIAQIESTFPDGTISSFEKNGKTYYSLVPEYTTDGGHLNEVGRKKVAEQFLLLLANLK